jgi:hypothetical protein
LVPGAIYDSLLDLAGNLAETVDHIAALLAGDCLVCDVVVEVGFHHEHLSPPAGAGLPPKPSDALLR